VEGSCENGNETSGSIKCWEVLELKKVKKVSKAIPVTGREGP
jgi:hypothetical protein